MRWDDYPNFSREEFDCKHTGLNEMQPEFMGRLQSLRTEAGFPFRITSGFRHVTHPIETRKTAPGWHSKGRAADIACDSWTAFHIVRLALNHGFTGIGISQKNGIPRFVHLDDRDATPVIYSY